jgi:CDP-6-deoxy-D-xylo-4-hexulose-3-dehydrase
MILKEDIKKLVENHGAPYIYNNQRFEPGKTQIYYSGPYWDNEEIIGAVDALMNGKWITAGENVHKFEGLFNKMFNTKYSMMVNSGSSANLVMIAGLKKYYEWDDGDEIIVSPSGFPTTISVIYQNRLTPVFVDIEWETLNFDTDLLELKITDKTKAIFLSPVLGNPPDMDKIMDICAKNNIKLILDNCDSLGSTWYGKHLNEYATASSTSFYPAHHITTGEGGMVSTDNEDLYKLIRKIATWGKDCYCMGAGNLNMDGACANRFAQWLPAYDGIMDHRYIFSNMGYNLKPLDLQGAIGLVQLAKFPKIKQLRQIAKAKIEIALTDNIEGVRGVSTIKGADVSWFGTPFVCTDKFLKRKLVRYLEDNKIQTRNYFAGNILMHPGYSFLDDYKKYPEANKVLDLVFFIGAAPFYGKDVFDYIEETVKKFKP